MALSMKKAQQQPPQQTQPQQPPQQKSWYTRGDATKQAIEEEDRRIERLNMTRDFWLKPDTSALITFVDGHLTPNGILDCFMYRQHTVNYHGKWTPFVCVADQEPCPICASGDNSTLVGAFTIIDHRTFEGKKGVYKDTKRLFVATRGTLKELQKLSANRGGLVGCTFEASRTGEKEPRVGNVFDFQQKREVAELRKMFVRKDPKTGKVETLFTPVDYASEINFLPASELRKLGFSTGSPVGSEKGPVDSGPASQAVADQL